MGYSGVGDQCGSSGSVGDELNPVSAINSTCTIGLNGRSASFISVAGAFPIAGTMTFTGFDGASSSETQNYLIFWTQDGINNSTCGSVTDVTITCVDNGEPNDTQNMHGNFVMDPRQTDFQVPVANPSDDAGHVYDATAFGALTNVTCPESGGLITCTFGKDDGSNVADIAYFGFNGATGVSNFPSS